MSEERKLGGRPAGVPNKLSGQAKENIVAVFTRLGGTAAMADWAKENLTDFYKIYSRLLPIDVGVDVLHRYVAEVPAVVNDTGEWAQQHTPPSLQ